jgi:hypothetical protein
MRLATLLVAGALAVGGCGSGASTLLHRGHRPSFSTGGATPDAVRVIRGWSQALRSGHVAAAAAFFRIPSVIFLGDAPPVQIRSRTDARIANAALPCGAELISTHRVGPFVNALFRLTTRPGRGGGGGCGSGTGETARTNFLIENGRIVEWLRAPDQPGDNGTPKTGRGQPTAPGPGRTPPPPETIPGAGATLA